VGVCVRVWLFVSNYSNIVIENIYITIENYVNILIAIIYLKVKV